MPAFQSLPESDLSAKYHLKAVGCEQQAKHATDQTTEQEWRQLAAQRHSMPEMVLRRDLLDAHSPLADALLGRVDAGEFDATDDEIDQGNARIMTGGMIAALAQKFNTPRA